MGLFDEQITAVRRFIDEAEDAGRLRRLDSPAAEPWPSGSVLVLEEDTALELGNPSVGSLSMLVWAAEGEARDGAVSLVGPDLAEASGAGLPFAQVVIAAGDFPNEYDSYRDLRDAVYDTRLKGLSVRAMPSKQVLWCRVSRQAADAGFSIGHLGAALLESLRDVPGVTAAEALFITSSQEDISRLSGAAAGARRLVDAMMKMYQENNFDCETCEYQDVCETVMDLKQIRKKLTDGKAVPG
jgi:CO dehydrogenase/acetyl-CoA synthase beta subunit